MNSKFRVLLVAMTFLLLEACDKNDPQPVGFFRASATSDYLTYQNIDDMWVFATDIDGNLLDGQQVLPGLTTILATPNPPEAFNLTVALRYGGTPGQSSFRTYADIANGAVLMLENPEMPNGPQPVGEVAVSVSNVPDYKAIMLSEGMGMTQLSTQTNNFVEGTLTLFDASANILVSSRKAIDQPVYKWIENAVSSGSYSVDFNDLQPYPKIVSTTPTFGMVSGLVAAKPGEPVYWLDNTYVNTPPTASETLKIGYMDGFYNYKLDVSTFKNFTENYRMTTYSKSGATLPSEITWSDNTCTISDKTIQGLAFSYSSTDYTYSMHEFSQTLSTGLVSWIIYAGPEDETPHINALPAAFTDKYPGITLSGLQFIASSFLKHVDGLTYSEFLNNVFDQEIPPDHEFTQDSFREF